MGPCDASWDSILRRDLPSHAAASFHSTLPSNNHRTWRIKRVNTGSETVSAIIRGYTLYLERPLIPVDSSIDLFPKPCSVLAMSSGHGSNGDISVREAFRRSSASFGVDEGLDQEPTSTNAMHQSLKVHSSETSMHITEP